VDRASGDGGSNDLPWASVFDPAANARALSAIQAEGFRAASELVDRFVRIAATGLNGMDRPATSATSPPTYEQPSDLFGATGLEPLVTSWWSIVDQFLRRAAPRDPDPGVAASATLDFSTAEVKGALHLEATGPGTATAEVWLHNGGPVDLGKVRLRCSDLLTHDGTVIPAHTLRFEPDIVPMPARCSRGVTVEVDVGEGLPPGSYRGTLLADGHPDIWLPIELAIKPLFS
jgi:hypothetical protein